MCFVTNVWLTIDHCKSCLSSYNWKSWVSDSFGSVLNSNCHVSVYLCNGKQVLQEENVYEFRLSMTSKLDVMGKVYEFEKKVW